MIKYIYSLLIGVLIGSCAAPEVEITRFEGHALGTSYHISYFSESEFDLNSGLDSIFNVINHSMSTYQDDSDISRVNRGQEQVQVDDMFIEVFQLSQKVHQQSNGYFDPTVGDLVNLYGFGAEQGVILPDSTMVDSLMQYVGLDKIRVSTDGLVTKESPEVYIEFNSVAKGYAVDVIGSYLDSKDIDNYLIELGGELLSKGRNVTKGNFWTVGVDNPQQELGQARELQVVLELRNRAMATSGNYRKYHINEDTGQKFVHTINPLTGYSEQGDMLSATVLADNCALADAYATAFMAMGFQQAREMLELLDNVDVYFLYLDSQEGMREFKTAGFQEVVLD